MKKYYWLAAVAAVFILFLSGFCVIAHFASKGSDKDIVQKETFHYQPEDTEYDYSQNGVTEQERGSEGVYANGRAKMEKESYYLIYSEGRVCIYRGEDKIFYDYAEINMDTMPIEIKEQLKCGLYVTGEQELYEFLQTYSS